MAEALWRRRHNSEVEITAADSAVNRAAGAYTRSQPELTLPLSAQLKLTLSLTQPELLRGCGPKVLNLSSNVSDASRRSSS
jgi:hypothetical protein